MRHRSRAPHCHLIRATIVFVALAGVVLLLSPAAADDRDLLRFDSAKPYLFIVLDTSASMAMRMGEDEWAPGGADGPDSRFYQAKQALFNVLQDVEDVHFGFAGYNQDGVHAVAKHWLYYSDQALPSPSDWPIQFPKPDLWDSDGDGSVLTRLKAIPRVDAEGDVIPIGSDPTPPIADTRVTEIGRIDLVTEQVLAVADLMTFGPSFPSTVGSDGRVVAGTCATPLDLANAADRNRVQSLAITGSGANPTWFWLRNGNNTKYLLSASRPGNRPDASLNAQIGRDSLHIVFTLRKVASGLNSCGTVDSATFDAVFGTRTLRRDLRIDPQLGEFFYVNQRTWAAGEGDESTMALWEHSDVVSRTVFGEKPHSGFGWEGNNDSGLVGTGDDLFDNALAADPAAHNADYCAPGAANCTAFIPTGSRIKPSLDTVPHPTLGRAFDRGDMLPFDWNVTHKDDFLTRLDPEHRAGFSQLGDFRVARHFEDAVSGYALPLVDDHVPLLAADISPLARALTDVRCWYLGAEGRGSNKCKEEGDPRRFEQGWSQVACGRDNSFGCRRNFLIVISDGEDNVAGQNASASIGDLKSQANMVTWALNVGDPSGCSNSSKSELKSIVTAGGGECVNVETQERLRQVLESLIGQIRTTARSFASAAVPSVQATVEQKIFLTSFLPFNDSPVWKGSVHSFVKPLPVSPAGIPLTEKKCDGTGAITVTDRSQGCHLWDAGKLLFERQYPVRGNDYLAFDDTALRRVFYAQQAPAEGAWPRRMRLFDPVEIAPDDGTNTQQVRFDLWRGFGLTFNTDESVNPLINADDETTANGVVDYALRVKRGTERSSDDPPVETPHDFLLGDIFHSTPVVIGTPSNNLYFATDLYGNAAECDPDDGTASANPGYRCFFEKQRFRRKMLLVGSNDGMLHAFDAGMFRTAGTDHWTGVALVDDVLSPNGSFDNGTGKELFAYVPRMVFPTLLQMQAGTSHKYTVDGTVTVADVFLDPVGQGSTAFPLADDREWRTIVVGGLREGGRGYFGLDITQPDPVEDHVELRFVPETADSGSNHPVNGDFVPVCTSSLTEASGTAGLIAPPTESGCGPVPFPAVLWEFTDSHFDTASGKLYYADEDRTTVSGLEAVTSNGVPDLAATWSTPSIGRIRLCRTGGTACDPTPDEVGDDADLVDVFVAVVGGGMDMANETYEELRAWRGGVPADASGNWLYMIDLETGEAIYKQQLVGAAPSEPAAVDTDGDGYLDRIYIGTVAGLLYRVDLDPIVVGGNTVLPSLQGQFVPHLDPSDSTADPLMIVKERLLPQVWRPVVLFDANHDGAEPSPWLRPIYQRPSVIFQAASGKYVLAFGTGDRFDLWNVPEPWPEERFYVFVDRFGSTAEIGNDPLTEADLTPIDPDLTGTVSTDLLASGGWVMRLAPKERVITDAFALSGVMVFSSFVPRTEDGAGNETEVGCADSSAEKVCSKQGISHVFVVNTTNANGLLFNSDSDDPVRYNVAPTFVTNPFAEPGQSKQSGAANEDGEFTADDLSVNMLKVMETLKGLFPPQCKFANYRVDIKTVAADTSLQFIAPVPVCLIERNWKEF